MVADGKPAIEASLFGVIFRNAHKSSILFVMACSNFIITFFQRDISLITRISKKVKNYGRYISLLCYNIIMKVSFFGHSDFADNALKYAKKRGKNIINLCDLK